MYSEQKPENNARVLNVREWCSYLRYETKDIHRDNSGAPSPNALQSCVSFDLRNRKNYILERVVKIPG